MMRWHRGSGDESEQGPFKNQAMPRMQAARCIVDDAAAVAHSGGRCAPCLP